MCALGTIFAERRELHIEDINYLVSELLDSKVILDMLEMLNMYNSKAIIYQVTLALSQTLHLLLNNKEMLVSRQERLVRETNMLLWSLYLVVGKGMKELASVIGLVVYGNVEFSKLMTRIIPKSIIKNFEAEKSLSEWRIEEWKDFFKLLQSDYKTATEQWNEECREELGATLKKTALELFEIKYNPEEENIKWNYKEFHVKYRFLEERCKVSKYYLKDLLYKNEADQYLFNEKIEKPNKFCTVTFALI
jgi:hypothetical protein